MQTEPLLSLSDTERQQQAASLVREIADLERRLWMRKQNLQTLQSDCRHDWAIAYTPEHWQGYRIEASGGGSDFTPAINVGPETVRRWTRTCKHCRKQQVTQRTKREQHPGAIPGTAAEVEVPVFD